MAYWVERDRKGPLWEEELRQSLENNPYWEGDGGKRRVSIWPAREPEEFPPEAWKGEQEQKESQGLGRQSPVGLAGRIGGGLGAF